MVACDKCGFRAKAEYNKDDMALTFCQHHADENHVILLSTGWVKIVEETLDEPVPALVH